MSDIAIRVENLSKQYKIGVRPPDRLKDLLSSALNGFFSHSRLSTLDSQPSTAPNSQSEIRNPKSEYIWALKDVSFEVKQGESLGIIGANGAGKSTLLKILSRITEPTSGRAQLYGRVGSLLEVGIGFDRELTGRENIYLNGAIIGMKKAEIDRRFDEIVDFSGVEKFIDTPVKRYSSGMHVRLAFAVAAHLEPEVLIVDEVLAVGDVAFQKKCLEKMETVAKEGRTVLFVSHNMGAIRSLCERTILIHDGEIRFDGKSPDVISQYLQLAMIDVPEDEAQVLWPGSDPKAPGCEEILLRGIKLKGPSGMLQSIFEPDKPIWIEIYHEIRQPLLGVRFNLHVVTEEGESAFSGTDCNFRDDIQYPGFYRSTCIIPGGLMNRRLYGIEISCYVPGIKVLIPRKRYLTFTVAGVGNQDTHETFEEAWPGVVCPQLKWKVEEITGISELHQSDWTDGASR